MFAHVCGTDDVPKTSQDISVMELNFVNPFEVPKRKEPNQIYSTQEKNTQNRKSFQSFLDLHRVQRLWSNNVSESLIVPSFNVSSKVKPGISVINLECLL